jgi:hypothetical protein
MTRIVRLDKRVYAELHVVSGGLQKQLGHRVSLSDSIDFLLHFKRRRLRAFWAKMRAKRREGLAGRGKKRQAPKAGKSRQKVHLLMNLRPEVS